MRCPLRGTSSDVSAWRVCDRPVVSTDRRILAENDGIPFCRGAKCDSRLPLDEPPLHYASSARCHRIGFG